MTLQNIRSSTADKRPNPASLSDGQLAINTAASTTGLFYKNASGALVKAGPVYIGTTAPNATPAAGGHAGNSVGETWLDTAGANPILKVWDGSTWRVVQPVTSGTVVSTADTGTVTSTMIANGTIVDADVNASAAIAGTKISPSFGAQNITTTGTSTAASYNPTSSTVPTNGVYLPAANSVGISTNGSGRLFVDSSGRVGAGVSSPGSYTFNQVVVGSSGDQGVTIASGTTNTGSLAFADGTVGSSAYSGLVQYSHTDDYMRFFTAGSERMRLDSSGRLGIGTSSASNTLHIAKADNHGITIERTGVGSGSIRLNVTTNGDADFKADNTVNIQSGNAPIIFYTNGNYTERARIDSSGRLLLGTSSARSTFGGAINARFSVEDVSGSVYNSFVYNANDAFGDAIVIGKSRGTTVGSSTVVQSGDEIGILSFQGADGTKLVEAANIKAFVDATPGANDMPGRLVFSTTADGASSPTERMRISNSGNVFINKTVYDTATPGIRIDAGGQTAITMAANTVLFLNRTTNDGTLVNFLQDDVSEGTISVSGTTVSYNGAHLSRWSQLPSGAERTEILRGTVLSNIDEMCEWGEEDNEQLNRMKVSDVEGDKNVAGVFQAWDDDDDTYTNDFYCAMTGDFIIRIGAGVTVERGDLLMSAGDGTAKPQDDDIIRSKTIAKVTSTNVTCTYDDGSYCVPCVLMAC